MQFNSSSRRAFLQQSAGGLGMTALSMLLAREANAAQSLPQTHHAPRAKSMIFLFMSGGPSQVDTFDPKPKLAELVGEKLDLTNARNAGYPFALPTAYKFAKHGQCGMDVSELFPNVATCVDDICLIRSMCADDNNHPGGTRQMFTGNARSKRPSFGSWLTYGLGSENANLPGYVVIGGGTRIGNAAFASGFLPAQYQGTNFSVGRGNVVRNANPLLQTKDQRAQLDLLKSMNRDHAERNAEDSRLNARIEAAELAFRMQAEAPESVDLNQESKATLDLYGITNKNKTTAEFGQQCLAARRLVECGVRVVHITQYHREWDHHGQLKEKLKSSSYTVDQPIAGLLKDLKQRDLLDETLVLWGGEFGRTPTSQGPDMNSRAHYPTAFTMWMAGGGVKGGHIHGETDELGTAITRDRVHVHDLHATLLWLMGMDHEKLTYRYGGRDYRLTDVYGKVVKEIMA